MIKIKNEEILKPIILIIIGLPFSSKSNKELKISAKLKEANLHMKCKKFIQAIESLAYNYFINKLDIESSC